MLTPLVGYLSCGLILAVISLVSAHRSGTVLNPFLFFVAHLLWPISVVATVVAAWLAPLPESGPAAD